jgi:hypothetical protein
MHIQDGDVFFFFHKIWVREIRKYKQEHKDIGLQLQKTFVIWIRNFLMSDFNQTFSVIEMWQKYSSKIMSFRFWSHSFITLQTAYNLWDFRISWRRAWRWLSSGLLRRVIWYKFTDVSEVLTASIIRAMCFWIKMLEWIFLTRRTKLLKSAFTIYYFTHYPDDGGSKHLWNVR